VDKAELTRRLRAVFVDELEDHVATWNRTLLRVERGESEGADDVKTLFRIAHSLKGAARTVALPGLEEHCHELEERLAGVRDRGEPLDRALTSRLFGAADVWAETARRLRLDQPIDDAIFEARPEPGPEKRGSIPPFAPEAGLRVPAARLDALLVRAGELTRAARRLEDRERGAAQLARRLRQLQSTTRVSERSALDSALEELDALHIELTNDAPELSRLARETDADVRQLRLTPFSSACEGLERVVRDAALTAQVEAELVISGGDVEIDRSVSTALRSPLVHLVRNAVAHGIERPERRFASGKPRVGVVTVSATLRGSDVQVAVKDDGRGLDLEALAHRAKDAGMTVPVDERGLARLVFVPGLSTAEHVDALSGRGVGLDVVKSEVEALLGVVDVTSEAGRGTRFTIATPLTRTVVGALLVRVGGQTFALPTTHVVTLRRLDPLALYREGEQLALALRHGGETLPFDYLRRILGMGASPPSHALVPIVIAEAAHDRVAFAVDELGSVEDVIVESLGPRLPRVRHMAGASVLADGTVALVLHGGDLIRTALRARARGEGPTAMASASARRAPLTLLAVDDSLTTLALAKTILESAGYRVLAASDAVRGLRLLGEAHVDLVVSDVEMPRMSGFELVEAMRVDPRLCAVPVVLLTALARDEDRARGLAAGADAYLVKNAFDQTELLDTIERLLRRGSPRGVDPA
jgi:two-component system chemotaxis sensor kinase CheA